MDVAGMGGACMDVAGMGGACMVERGLMTVSPTDAQADPHLLCPALSTCCYCLPVDLPATACLPATRQSRCAWHYCFQRACCAGRAPDKSNQSIMCTLYVQAEPQINAYNGLNFTSYSTRYGMALPTWASNSPTYHYYSTDIGPVHLIALSDFIGGFTQGCRGRPC